MYEKDAARTFAFNWPQVVNLQYLNTSPVTLSELRGHSWTNYSANVFIYVFLPALEVPVMQRW